MRLFEPELRYEEELGPPPIFSYRRAKIDFWSLYPKLLALRELAAVGTNLLQNLDTNAKELQRRQNI